MLPPTILTEAVAQVGAIMILAKPENREKLIFFMGIERVRYRRPVHPGDVVVIEATVRRLRSRMGVLKRHRTRGRQGRGRRHDDLCAWAAEPLIPPPARYFRTSSTIPAFAARDAQTAHFASGLK